MIYLNLGRREVGKTTLASYLIAKSETRVIFDPRGLFTADIRAVSVDQIDGAFRLLASGRLREIVITPDADLHGCFDRACEHIKGWLQSGRSDIAFLIDELRFVPRESIDGPDLNWILRCATRDSVIVVFTAHRPVDVSTDIRAISDVWCIFQMTQENDLKVIAERCSPAVSQRVARLPERHFIAWNDAKGRMTAHVHPERWFVPLQLSAPFGADHKRPSPIDDLNGDGLTRDDGKFDFSV